VSAEALARDAGYRVRRAVTEDIEPAAVLLAEVFESYPWMTWTVEQTDRRHRLTEMYRAVLATIVVPGGTAWLCERRSAGSSAQVGVAGWLCPDAPPPDEAWEELATTEVRMRGSRLEAHRRAETQLEAVRPSGPHWFLGTVGVLPGHRGRGIAAALLQPGLLAAAADRLEAYLETSRYANLHLYQRLGFETSAVVEISGDGPTVWCMRRRP
jgi:GNAT superfamily N-acetyltransferase